MKSQARKFESCEQNTALTPVEYMGLQEAFDHFNSTLFDGSVPDCFFTYQRKAGSAGSFAADEFSGRTDELIRDGIRLNPDTFVNASDAQILQNLVFLMCRAWQWHHGKRSTPGYVNRELADKMKSVRLQPTSTGGVGGPETGSRIFHYVIPKGAFACAYEELVSYGWHLNLQSTPREGPKDRARNKNTFICSNCRQRVFGKPRTAVHCSPCLELKLAELGIDVALVADSKMKNKDAPVPIASQSYEINQPLVDLDDRRIPTVQTTGEEESRRDKTLADRDFVLAMMLEDPNRSMAKLADACRLQPTHDWTKVRVQRVMERSARKALLNKDANGKWQLTGLGRAVAAKAAARIERERALNSYDGNE